MIGFTDTLRQSASAEDELLEQIFMHIDSVAGPDEVGYRLCESAVHPGQLLADVDSDRSVNADLVELRADRR